MNDRTYFVVAVSIALVVPMIFGSMYFLRVRGIKENAHYVMLLRDEPDLLIVGDTTIENESISNEQQVANFSVQYVKGETGNLKYHLVLDRFDDLEDVEITWKLDMYDELSGEYKSYTSGILNNMDSKKVNLNSYEIINPLEIHKFKLYYSLNGDSQKLGKLKSNILLEQE